MCHILQTLKPSFTIVCAGGMLLANFNLAAAERRCGHDNLHLPKTACAREVRDLIKEDHTYRTLYKTLNPFIPQLTELTGKTTDQTSYSALLALADQIASKLPTGRLVIVDPDGLVVVDTAKSNNTYANYMAGANPSTFSSTVNVNHNSRIAIIDAQQEVCGLGVEIKRSNTTGTEQQYVAIRLGHSGGNLHNNSKSYLHNEGTARISVNVGAIE